MNKSTSPTLSTRKYILSTTNPSSSLIDELNKQLIINSPSQNTQSHAHRKQVVANGLWHKLHDNDGAAIGRLDEATEPLEVPGGAISLVFVFGLYY